MRAKILILMKVLIIICATMGYVFGATLPSEIPPSQCGIDNSRISVVYEGFGKIETYPWLGTLTYPFGDKWVSTVVVLVTKQIALAVAADVDKLPKIDFRSRSKVFLGTNCTGTFVCVKDYSFHPDYAKSTLTAPAIIQLEYHRIVGFWPICAPPLVLNNARFYAVSLPKDCHKSTIQVYSMAYVDLQQCKEFYKISGLDIDSIWPTYPVCAKALSDKECIWRSGTVLAMKQNRQWSLVGLGVLGPGCRCPARFMEYSSYQPWVRNALLRVGTPTVTRVDDQHIVLRRKLNNIQRYGRCDPEETKAELYTDSTSVEKFDTTQQHRIRYNFTIFANIDYSCVIFKVKNRRLKSHEKPKIFLRRWCVSPKPLCYGSSLLQVDFYLEIYFKETITYTLKVYGKEFKFVDIKRTLAYINSKKMEQKIPILTTPVPKFIRFNKA